MTEIVSTCVVMALVWSIVIAAVIGIAAYRAGYRDAEKKIRGY